MSLPIDFSRNPIDWNAISTLSGVTIAAAGLIISHTSRQRARQAERTALLAGYRKEIIAFSKDFFELVATALALRKETGGSLKNNRELILLSKRLSGLVDTGRFLFSNHIRLSDKSAETKGEAFGGIRRPAVDAILAAFYVVEAMTKDGDQVSQKLYNAMPEVRKTKQPLTQPERPKDPIYLLLQSRRCHLKDVILETFPRERLEMFKSLLGPVQSLERDTQK